MYLSLSPNFSMKPSGISTRILCKKLKTSQQDADLYFRWTQLKEAAQSKLKLGGDDALPLVGLNSLANVHGALRGSSNGADAVESTDQDVRGTEA